MILFRGAGELEQLPAAMGWGWGSRMDGCPVYIWATYEDMIVVNWPYLLTLLSQYYITNNKCC